MTDQPTYQCMECGLHYVDAEIAQQCETYCKTYHACSMEITQHSVEAQTKAGSLDQRADASIAT